MTAQLKPKPIRKKRVSTSYKPKTMTEQTARTQTPASLPSLPKPYVQSHLSDIQLISRDALLNDFKNRMKINNREIGYAWSDFKDVVKATQPYISKVVNYSKDAVGKLRS